MNVAAVTKFKQGDLYAALKRAGWTQSELARRAGISVGALGQAINLRKRPSSKISDSIQRAFGEVGIFVDVLSIWPEEFEGFDCPLEVDQITDVPTDSICELSNSLDKGETVKRLESALKKLPQRMQDVLKMRFYEEKPLREVAKAFKVGPERIRQIEGAGLRRLRHPATLRFIEAEEITA